MYYVIAVGGGLLGGIVLDQLFAGRVVAAVKTELGAVEQRIKSFVDAKLK